MADESKIKNGSEKQKKSQAQYLIQRIDEIFGPTRSSFVYSITPPSVNMSGSLGATRDPNTIERIRELEETTTRLRRRVDQLMAELADKQSDTDKLQSVIEELQSTNEELSKKENLGFLLPRINGTALGLLFKDPAFAQKFIQETESNVFVMSIDIRRSTELMAKARTAKQFANFMTQLCTELENVIKVNYGVVDKFTGDGLLAFFPEFFSEDHAGMYAVSAADQCHKIFKERYKEHRNSFYSVLKGVGLGIGIDYGLARLVQIAGGLTVVGIPVVYACRMGGAEAGTTLLNQPAYEKLNEQFSSYCLIKETEINIKNEGLTLAYEIRLGGKKYVLKPPSWARESQSGVKEDVKFNA